MSEFLATARVQIVPITTGFQAALRTQVKQAIATAGIFKIPIVPELTKFRAAFKAELRATPISVPVVPDITGFRELLQAQVKTASKGVAVTVPVIPSGKAGTGTGVKGTSGQTATTKAATAATTKLTAAQIRANAVDEALVRVKTKVALALSASNRATSASLSLTEKDTLLKGASTKVSQALARAETLHADAIVRGELALARKIELELKNIQTLSGSISASGRIVSLELAVATAREAANEALRKSAVLGKTAGALRKQDNALKAVEAELEKATALATTSGNRARQTEIAAIERQIAARRALIEAEAANLKSGKAAAGQQATALRGARATGASLFGVRGATLAASDAFLVGAVAVAVLAKAIKSAADLETELNVFQVTAGATADQMERVSDVAKQLGADITLPAVSAGDAATAFTNLAKAGLDVEDSVDGARGVLQLATAAQIENAEATELVASALNAFSLSGRSATHVADLLTGASIEAQGSISDMGIALQQSSAVARQAGLNLEDTVSFITLLARAGIRGSDAGTSLRTALLRLIAPTETAQKELKKLEIAVLDSTGAVRPEVFSELQTALSNLNATARNQVLRKIFGQDAIRAAVIFGREGAIGLNEVRDAINEEGLAAELAEARTKGFAGQVEALKNSVATLGVTLGQVLIPVAGELVGTFSAATTAINDTASALEDLRKILPGGSGGGDGGFDFNFVTGRDVIEEARLGFELGLRDVPFQFKRPTEAAREFNEEIIDTIHSATGLKRQLAEVKGPEAAVKIIEDLESKIIGSSEEAQAAKLELAEIKNVILALGHVPSIVEIEALLEEGSIENELAALLKKLGRDPVKIKAALDENSKIFLGQQFFLLGQDNKAAFLAGFGNIFDIPQEPPTTFGFGDPRLKPGPAEALNSNQIANRLLGFDDLVTQAEISGSVSDKVQALRAKQAFIQSQLARKDISGAGKGPLLETRRNLQGELVSSQNEIEGILQDRETASKEVANRIKAAKEKADQDAIDAFGRKEENIENKVLIAEATDDVRDDITANKKLRSLLRAQVRNAEERIKDLTARRDFVRATKKKILQLTLEIKGDKKELAEQLAEDAQERREIIRESISLKIEFFGIVGNEKAEIRARQRLIQNLQKEINAIKKQGKLTQEKKNRIQELKNEQARERAAIKELNDEKEKTIDATAALMFTFLQSQQGFAANLLGNLFPSSATGGLVGGGSGPVVGAGGIPGGAGTGGDQGFFGIGGGPLLGLQTQAAKKPGPPTFGQAATEVDILRQMLQVLREIQRGKAHPEAKYQKTSSGSALDVM